MKFIETGLEGAYIIEPEKLEDDRGFFARIWCKNDFEEHGLNTQLVQSSISYNAKKGTLRGMHYQLPPHAEVKLIRCTRGSIFDVIIDMQPDSTTFMQYKGIHISADNYKVIYVPKGFAHGFQTLEDHTEVQYQMSDLFYPEAARGLRWNDPAFGIDWPDNDKRIISDKDNNWPLFEQQ